MTRHTQDQGPASTTTTSTTTNTTTSPTVCPDPSAHDKAHRSSKLQDQAAGAALYATQPKRDANYPLGPDKKLSSAGAATSLKYARAQDLPSFPSVGIDTKTSGLTAATLASKNKSTVEWWTPQLSADASKAAMLAKDYKMEPLWQPEPSSASSKAAMLAHQGPGRDWWQPQASEDGLSAAGIAMRNKGLSPQLDYGYTETGKRNSLLAARLSVRGRKRAESQPTPNNSYPDAHNASSNALNAATLANVSRLGPNSMPRDMYTEHPPVRIEVDEKKHQDALQASAISMAKSMYAMQKVDDDGNITIDHGRVAASAAHDVHSTGSNTNIKSQALQYLTLQDAAQRLAAERLAKIGNQHENAAFRDYWGQPGQKRRSRLSMKSGPRRRASSEGRGDRGGRNLDLDSDDERQARRVRSQMSQFNTQLAEVDAKKRGQDRQNLIAAAERKVQAQMSKLDEKIYNETGQMSPAMVEEWDNRARTQARARIAAASEKREQNRGKVDIGGGKFLDQSEIDNIAAARVQPTLDHINETAEKQRARDEEIRLDQAEAKRQAHVEKTRQAELKAEQKRAKQEEKQASKIKKQEEKESAKLERNVEKEKKSEWTRLVKHENRKSMDTTRPAVVTRAPAVDTADATATPVVKDSEAADADAHVVERVPTTSTASTEPSTAAKAATLSKSTAPKPTDSSRKALDSDNDTPTTSTSKNRFSSLFTKLKRKPKAGKESASDDAGPTKGFEGGAAYTNRMGKPTSTTPSSAAPLASPSMSSLSSSGDDDDDEVPRGRTQSRSRDVSTESDEFEEARDRFDEGLAPPPVFGSGGAKTASPVRDSKFIEAL